MLLPHITAEKPPIKTKNTIRESSKGKSKTGTNQSVECREDGTVCPPQLGKSQSQTQDKKRQEQDIWDEYNQIPDPNPETKTLSTVYMQ